MSDVTLYIPRPCKRWWKMLLYNIFSYYSSKNT
nr:MAG TPA: hypothetical protein [Caudoviricetes sp.]